MIDLFFYPIYGAKWFFRLQLTFCLMRWGGYFWKPLAAWRYSGEECWLEYWRREMSGIEAWREDCSYAD